LRKIGGVLALLAGIAAYCAVVAPRWLRVTRLVVSPPNLPEDYVGLRIAHLSDFHAGGENVSLSMLWQARRSALEFQPDLIALTGDFFDDGEWVETNGLYRDWPDGVPVLAVLGNHDWRGGPGNMVKLRDELNEAGVQLLVNEAWCGRVRGQETWVVAVDDPHLGRDDVSNAFAGLPQGRDALLFLSHSPSAVTELEPGRALITLSGHTHGGQVRLLPSGQVPFVRQIRKLRGLPPQPELPIAHGWGWLNGSVVIVSDGLGLSTFGVRWRTRPHLILIELGKAPLDGPPCDDVSRYVTDVSEESWLTRWLT
jgi:hypothetical protein